MLIKNYNLIFLLSLILGTIIAISSSSWVIAWIGLEINLMSFIPLLINKIKSNSIEMAIKYFLVQVMASFIIILVSVLFLNLKNYEMSQDMNLLISMSLAMKAGVAPFHFWFPQVMEYSEWFQSILILTWQKMAPLILISFSFNFTTYVVIISSAVLGSMGGLNQISLKKILTFSSIIHSAWMISIIFISDSLWWLYFSVYTLMTLSIIMPISFLKLESLNMINFLSISLKNKTLVLLNLLSIAGLPPFLGFSIKLMAINSMIYIEFNKMIIFILITSSLIAFYFYSRVMYTAFLSFKSKPKLIYFSPEMNKKINKMILISFYGNLFISMFAFFM